MKISRHFLPRNRLLVVACVTLTLITLAPIAQAHDIVLVPESTGLRVRLGHPGDWQSVDVERLLELQTMTGDAVAQDKHSALKRSGLDMVLAKSAAKAMAPQMAAARYDNGLWVELPAVGKAKAEWRNTSRFMLPGAAGVMASIKFAKGYAGNVTDTVVYARKTGHLLELIPQKNPLSLREGEKLPVLLLLNGKPLAGQGIEVSNLKDKMAEDKIPRFTTDANGMAQVPVRPRGVNTLAVDLKRPNDGSFGSDAKALPVENIMMVATYTFIR